MQQLVRGTFERVFSFFRRVAALHKTPKVGQGEMNGPSHDLNNGGNQRQSKKRPTQKKTYASAVQCCRVTPTTAPMRTVAACCPCLKHVLSIVWHRSGTTRRLQRRARVYPYAGLILPSVHPQQSSNTTARACNKQRRAWSPLSPSSIIGPPQTNSAGQKDRALQQKRKIVAVQPYRLPWPDRYVKIAINQISFTVLAI